MRGLQLDLGMFWNLRSRQGSRVRQEVRQITRMGTVASRAIRLLLLRRGHEDLEGRLVVVLPVRVVSAVPITIDLLLRLPRLGVQEVLPNLPV